MSRTMFLDIEGRLGRADFDSIATSLGIMYRPQTIGGNTYYRQCSGELVAVKFGGNIEKESNAAYATQLIIDNCPNGLLTAYEAMRNTVLDLGEHIEIATISGDFVDQIHGSGGAIYSPAVFEIIDRRWDEIEDKESRACAELRRQIAELPKPFDPTVN